MFVVVDAAAKKVSEIISEMKSLSTHNVLIKLRISSLIKLSIVCGQS